MTTRAASVRQISLGEGSGRASTPGSAAEAAPSVRRRRVVRLGAASRRVSLNSPYILTVCTPLAGIFLLLKKSAQSSEKRVVLKENAQTAPEDRL